MTGAERPTRLVRGTVAEGEVTSLHPDGDARGTVLGREVRVRGGVPGDRGTFVALHVGKNAAWVAPEHLDTPSPDRVEPPCPVVLRCGGCPWQMVALPAQREARRAFLEAELEGLPVGELRATVTARAATGYRTRALMMTRRVKGQLRLGFFAPRTDDIVPAPDCAVQHPALNAAMEAARQRVEAGRVTIWKDADNPGVLRAVAGRLDPVTRKTLLTFVVTREDPRLLSVARALMSDPRIAGVHACVNDALGGQLLRGETFHLAGAKRIRLTFDGVQVLCGPTSFVQTQQDAGEALVRTVRELAPARVEHLVDLYAGIGVFGFALRSRAGRVTLVESNAEAVSDARETLASAPDARPRVEVIEADAAEAAPGLVRRDEDTCVILDPPRAGAGPAVLDALTAALPATILYISCHPASLARDGRTLAAAGYRLDVVVPIEMFPHTPHLEVVARFVRGDHAAGPAEPAPAA